LGRCVSLRATEQPIDTGTAAGKCFLDMLGVFAEFQTNLRRERQLEGIAKAKAAGVYKGRQASIDAVRVREMEAQGLGATAIAKELGIGRASVYRVLEGGCGDKMRGERGLGEQVGCDRSVESKRSRIFAPAVLAARTITNGWTVGRFRLWNWRSMRHPGRGGSPQPGA
jgi:hypothetical protein